MFGRNENTSEKITTMLGPGSDLQGSLYAEGSARVDGNVNGNVTVTGMLILGSAGRISGDVTAEAVILGGGVLGNVTAPERAELTATARVSGDVTTRVIVIDEHAVFQGRCNMDLPAADTEEDHSDRRPVLGRKTPSGETASNGEIKQKIMEVLRKDAEDRHLEEQRQEGRQEDRQEGQQEDQRKDQPEDQQEDRGPAEG